MNLPIVDQNYRLTGTVCGANCGTVSVAFERDFEFQSLSGRPFVARLMDVNGRLVATRSGKGAEPVRFDQANLKPGVYIMSVKVGKEAPVTRRYMITPKST